jgi:NDP-sugar pyrophosphorylase family protein
MTTQALAADAAVYATRDGEPTGIFRFRCGALATLPARGFVDMKEQGLPSLASRFDVRVITTDDPAPISIRTLDAYIEALRWLANGKTKTHHGPSEDWRCTFSLIEPGAEVHPTARVHDSVVLAGSKVGRDAVVVRSLVGPAGVVGAGRSAFDELVGDPEAE